MNGTLQRGPRTQPTAKECQLLQAVGSGARVRDLSVEWGFNYYTLTDRLRRLKRISGLRTMSGLVYWGLTNLHIHYSSVGLTRLDDRKLEIVEQLALGKSDAEICKKLYLSQDGFERRVRDARFKVGAVHRPHLVAICWSEDWIA